MLLGFRNCGDPELGRRILCGEEWVSLFDMTAERNEGKNGGRTEGRRDSNPRCPRSPACELPDGHKSDGSEHEERLKLVHEGGGITSHVAGTRVEPEGSDDNDNNDTHAQQSLCEIFRQRGKSEGEDKESERESELHQEKTAKISKYGKTGVM